ncbi:alpha/beta hydrolase family protein [Psychrosphaera sp.]|nr:alpha/beta hydrolase family protein [Psychrosphaera sp.]
MYSSAIKLVLLITLLLNSNLVNAAVPADSANNQTTNQLTASSLLFQDLKRYIPQQNVQVLQTEKSEQFIALHKEETTGIPKGIAFILPDVNQSIFKQAVTTALYKDLDNYGWTSLVLTMPSLPELKQAWLSESENKDEGDLAATSDQSERQGAAPNTSDDSSQQTESQDDQQTESTGNITNNVDQAAIDPSFYAQLQDLSPTYEAEFSKQIQQAIGERLEAGFEFTSIYPGFYLMICEGQSCFWLNRLIAEQKIPEPDGLIMIGAYMPQTDLNRAFADEVAKTEFPVLDIISANHNQWTHAIKKWRKKMARKNFKTNYRQRELTFFFDYRDQQRRLIKEIYGFTNAVGL